MQPSVTRVSALLASCSVVVFLSVFNLAHRYDLQQVDRLFRTLLASLDVAARTRDDLALIDWAGRIPESSQASALEARVGGRILTAQGRLDLLQRTPWYGHMVGLRTYLEDGVFQDAEGREFHLRLAVRTDPGPVSWGFFSVILFLTGAWVVRSLLIRAKPTPLRQTSTAKSGEVREGMGRADHDPEGSMTSAILFLDGRWNILYASPPAENLMGGPISRDAHPHILPWEPTSALLKALESDHKTTVPLGFNRFPNIPVTVKPLKGGGYILHMGGDEGL